MLQDQENKGVPIVNGVDQVNANKFNISLEIIPEDSPKYNTLRRFGNSRETPYTMN